MEEDSRRLASENYPQHSTGGFQALDHTKLDRRKIHNYGTKILKGGFSHFSCQIHHSDFRRCTLATPASVEGPAKKAKSGPHISLGLWYCFHDSQR